MKEPILIQLVDAYGNEVGRCEKLAAHQNGGVLHRAVSVVLMNSRGQFLLQRRALTKYHFGGLWANTCCSHPQGDETPLEAAVRALAHEMGMSAHLQEVARMTYMAEDRITGLVEKEYDHVFFARSEVDPEPNPNEVDEYAWVDGSELAQDLASQPERFVPWLPHVLHALERSRLEVFAGLRCVKALVG